MSSQFDSRISCSTNLIAKHSISELMEYPMLKLIFSISDIECFNAIDAELNTHP